MAYKYSKGDFEYYVPNKKKPIAYSTKAVGDWLNLLFEMNPTYTFNQLKESLLDKTKYIRNDEAIEVLQKYIDLGYGDVKPHWYCNKNKRFIQLKYFNRLLF